MAKRYPGKQCAHVWAQQDQPSGQNSNGQFFFEGPTLYSYGTHFPVGRFITNDAGQRAVLLNSDDYSVTTSKHKSWAWSATDGLDIPVFHVPGCNQDHAANLAYMVASALEEAAKVKRARVYKASLAERAMCFLDSARKYAEFFEVGFSVPDLDGMVAELETARVEHHRSEIERQRIQREREAGDFADWQIGKRDSCPACYHTDERGSAYMRMNGDNLETSRGASVPLAQAVRVFAFVKACRERGEAWHSNGRVVRVGHFTITEITAEGNMRAGCHFFTWERIEAAAQVAGVASVAPSSGVVEDRAA